VPITVTLNPPNHEVGPGFSIQLSSDFIGPLPIGSTWRVRGCTDVEFRNALIDIQVPAPGHQYGGNWLNWDQSFTAATNQTAAAGTTVHVQAELLNQSFVVIDSGVADGVWQPSAGLGVQAFLNTKQQGQGGGALTPEQNQLLVDTERRTQALGEPVDLVIRAASGLVQTTLAQLFSRQTLDVVTLGEVTNGPTCEPVRASVDRWWFGVVIRVTTIPDELVPKTPDEQWYFPDLAVLRVFRGQDLEYRRGIHTPTFMTDHAPWQYSSPLYNLVQVFGAPPDTTIAVDWRAGCCGQVWLQVLP
jgi:hypothetical protein